MALLVKNSLTDNLVILMSTYKMVLMWGKAEKQNLKCQNPERQNSEIPKSRKEKILRFETKF